MAAEDRWNALQHVNEWIRFADAKAVATLAASSVLGGLLINTAPKLEDFRTSAVSAVLFAVAGACVVLSVFLTSYVLLPRVRRGRPISLLHFDHVARTYQKDQNGFARDFDAMVDNPPDLNTALANQVWANSLVAHRKFRLASWSVLSFGLALICAGAGSALDRVLGW